MTTRFRTALAVFLWCTLSAPAHADVTVVKEVVIGPKRAAAAANIGSVNSSPNVRMTSAVVDIFASAPKDGTTSPLTLTVKALFDLENQADEGLKLTVGFPVSNSLYSSFDLTYFRVVTDGGVREVFRRKSSYPRQLVHEYISGEKGPGEAVPPADIASETTKMFGNQYMGRETFQNLMVWEESFAAKQKKKVEVSYEVQVPLQAKSIVRKKVEGNYKGIWPQEANNVPPGFLNRLPEGSYYFFDYYLTSGASWAGTIGAEDVRLHFGPDWQDHDLHTSTRGKLVMSGGVNAGPGAPTSYNYLLRDEEPVENIYFAIRPGKDNSQRP